MGGIMPTTVAAQRFAADTGNGMRSPLHYWRQLQRTRGLRRELLIFALCLGVGLLVMPLLIWLVGSLELGPYANGGLVALLRDYYIALAGGALAQWLVGVGPYPAGWLLGGRGVWVRGVG